MTTAGVTVTATETVLKVIASLVLVGLLPIALSLQRHIRRSNAISFGFKPKWSNGSMSDQPRLVAWGEVESFSR